MILSFVLCKMLIYIKITDRLKKKMKGNNFEKVVKLDKGDI